MQPPAQDINCHAPHFSCAGIVRDQCRLETKSAARSNESFPSRMLRSFLAGSNVIPIALLYIQNFSASNCIAVRRRRTPPRISCRGPSSAGFGSPRAFSGAETEGRAGLTFRLDLRKDHDDPCGLIGVAD